jgi:hypothetical protein
VEAANSTRSHCKPEGKYRKKKHYPYPFASSILLRENLMVSAIIVKIGLFDFG